MSGLTLAQLSVYPVKSLAGIAVTRWEVAERGLRLDRELMLVDPAGLFVSQREAPRLALVSTELSADQLILRAPPAPPLHLSLARRSSDRLPVIIWNDTVLAEPVDAAADEWLSRHLGAEVRLVRFPDTGHRQVDLGHARSGCEGEGKGQASVKRSQRGVAPPRARGQFDAVGFADGFPFLLTTEASLADLARRVDLPLTMARFRPNLVVAGATAFAEDGWRRVRVGSIEFDMVKPCGRCVMVNVDPETGEAGREPLRTLASFRNAGGKVLFGWNLLHRATGVLEIGDDVEILA
jgi:uncharacterized protein